MIFHNFKQKMNLIRDSYASSSDDESTGVLSKRMRVLEKGFLTDTVQLHDHRHDMDISIGIDNEMMEIISPTIKKALSDERTSKQKEKSDWQVINAKCTHAAAEYMRRKSTYSFTTKKTTKNIQLCFP